MRLGALYVIGPMSKGLLIAQLVLADVVQKPTYSSPIFTF